MCRLECVAAKPGQLGRRTRQPQWPASRLSPDQMKLSQEFLLRWVGIAMCRPKHLWTRTDVRCNDQGDGLQRTQRRDTRKPRTDAQGARSLRGLVSYRPTIQRASVREEDCLVLADDSAALASKHHWLIVACDACDTVIDPTQA